MLNSVYEETIKNNAPTEFDESPEAQNLILLKKGKRKAKITQKKSDPDGGGKEFAHLIFSFHQERSDNQKIYRFPK